MRDTAYDRGHALFRNIAPVILFLLTFAPVAPAQSDKPTQARYRHLAEGRLVLAARSPQQARARDSRSIVMESS